VGKIAKRTDCFLAILPTGLWNYAYTIFISVKIKQNIANGRAYLLKV